MGGGKTCAHLVNGDGTGGVCLDSIKSWAYLFTQPTLDGAVTGHQHPQTITNNFALTGVSPAATFDLMASAMSLGKVMLNCWVVRMAVSDETSRI